MVDVILAGYNVDRNALEDLVRKGAITNDDLKNFLTPETISAAYARISRDPAAVTELRRVARGEVEKARKSNQAIIFKMGHHSVAEHAVLNFDILGISKLAIETLEAQRLCSYTEKSQRYIKLGEDYIIPNELKGFEAECRDLFHAQNKAYNEFYAILGPYFQDSKRHIALAHEVIDAEEEQIGKKFSAETRQQKLEPILDGWAKEDARYTLSLATTGQLGFTTNARDLEKFIKYTTVHQLKEVQELGKKLYDSAMSVIPSLLLFFEPNDYLRNSKRRIKQHLSSMCLPEIEPYPLFSGDDEVKLVMPDKEADNKLVATLIRSGTGKSYTKAYAKATCLTFNEKKEIVKKTLEGIQQWDAVPREFEIPELTYEIIMSASCFAQFKRHRMLTLLPGPYEPAFGYTIPPSIEKSGLSPEFNQIMHHAETLYDKIKKEMPETEAAAYVLTNAHNRRVFVKMNVRELYHVSRFREDLHAQWDIREKATKMVELAKGVMPLAMLLIGGKHEFQKIYNSAYSD